MPSSQTGFVQTHCSHFVAGADGKPCACCNREGDTIVPFEFLMPYSVPWFYGKRILVFFALCHDCYLDGTDEDSRLIEARIETEFYLYTGHRLQ